MSLSELLPWTLCLLLAVVAGLVLRRALILNRRLASTREELHRMHQALESASDGIGIGDMESNSLYHNPAHVALFGYSVAELNASDEPAALFADKAVAAKIHSEIRAGRSWRGETEIKSKDGRIIPAYVRADLIRGDGGEPLGIFGVFTDITERRAAERALAEERERSARAQRLESLGLMAGGIAHDFGNVLSIILCYSGLVRDDPRLPAGSQEHIRLVEDAAHRARGLSQSLLRFARGSSPDLQPTALAPIVEAAAAGAVAGSKVRLELNLEPELPSLDGDPVQLDQVFSNLAVNAVQAMEQGGTLTVRAWSESTESGRRWLRVQVRDTGCGIPAEQLARIWEPFFTSKRRGTGLGLATTYNVIRNHRGDIVVESTVGVGTTFTVSLPARTAA